MKLMFLHPVDYGRKAEELLWRKVYYEVIQLIKTNKKASIRGCACLPISLWNDGLQRHGIPTHSNAMSPGLAGSEGGVSAGSSHLGVNQLLLQEFLLLDVGSESMEH